MNMIFKIHEKTMVPLCMILFLLLTFNESIAQATLVFDNSPNANNATTIRSRILGEVRAAGKIPNVAATPNLNSCGNIAYNPDHVRNNVTTGQFKVNYTGFTPEAQNAFQYAVDIWSKILNLTVPIEINANFAPLAPGVLGQAGPDAFYSLGSIVFPEALADQLVSGDIGGADMNMTFSSTFPFYFGLDGCPGATEFDFATIVLHEIGHGLGFLSSDFTFEANSFPQFFGANHPAGACVGFAGFTAPLPYIFDLGLKSASFGGTPYNAMAGLTPFAGLQNSGCFIGLNEYFTRNDLTFIGADLQACLGGPAKIYAPNPYRRGSSISHFDEATYAGVHANALLTPFVAPGEAIHDPGCALAVLKDIGYDVNDLVPGEIAAVAGLPPPNPIPTMSEWGIIILGLLIMNMGIFFIQRKIEQYS
jgi:hypothetical protein